MTDLGMASFQQVVDEFTERGEAMILIRIRDNPQQSGIDAGGLNETVLTTTRLPGFGDPNEVARILRHLADRLESPDTIERV